MKNCGRQGSDTRRKLLSLAPVLVVAPIVGALSPFATARSTQPQPFSPFSPSSSPPASAASPPEHGRNVPPGFEMLPTIGMGTWRTFDVGDNASEQDQRRRVLKQFFAAGGGMIDSSPMYGSAEWLLGQLLGEVDNRGKLISATKVWTALDAWGPKQLEQSLRLWGQPHFDVVLVHNLLNWRAHMKLLRRWKDEGRARWIGISTSHAVANDEAMKIIRAEKFDVLQITYNLADPGAEKAMDLAASRGMAVVINRPFDGGGLFGRVRHRPRPGWTAEIDCSNWAQVFLKWVVSHPAVTCAIPATRIPEHMAENMGARLGRMPDPAMRRKIQEILNG